MMDMTHSPPLFDRFLVVRLREGTEDILHPYIAYEYPTSSSSLPPLPHDLVSFCFPDASVLHKSKTSIVSFDLNFTFVLTDITGFRIFGFCRRHSPVNIKTGALGSFPECICLLSRHPFFSLFTQILEILDTRWQLAPGAVFPFLCLILQHPLPLPGEAFRLNPDNPCNNNVSPFLQQSSPPPLHTSTYILSRNDDDMAASVSLEPLFSSLSVDNVISLVCALLCEKRVLLVASKLSLLSSCCHGALSLLYPLCWQHLYIPLLPPHLLSYVCAPYPFIMGIKTQNLSQVLELPLSELLVVDLDAGTLSTCTQRDEHSISIPTFPSTISAILKKRIRNETQLANKRKLRREKHAQKWKDLKCDVEEDEKEINELDNVLICIAFLTAMTSLLEGWRDYITPIASTSENRQIQNKKANSSSRGKKRKKSLDKLIFDIESYKTANETKEEEKSLLSMMLETSLFVAFTTDIIDAMEHPDRSSFFTRFFRHESLSLHSSSSFSHHPSSTPSLFAGAFNKLKNNVLKNMRNALVTQKGGKEENGEGGNGDRIIEIEEIITTLTSNNFKEDIECNEQELLDKEVLYREVEVSSFNSLYFSSIIRLIKSQLLSSLNTFFTTPSILDKNKKNKPRRKELIISSSPLRHILGTLHLIDSLLSYGSDRFISVLRETLICYISKFLKTKNDRIREVTENVYHKLVNPVALSLIRSPILYCTQYDSSFFLINKNTSSESKIGEDMSDMIESKSEEFENFLDIYPMPGKTSNVNDSDDSLNMIRGKSNDDSKVKNEDQLNIIDSNTNPNPDLIIPDFQALHAIHGNKISIATSSLSLPPSIPHSQGHIVCNVTLSDIPQAQLKKAEHSIEFIHDKNSVLSEGKKSIVAISEAEQAFDQMFAGLSL